MKRPPWAYLKIGKSLWRGVIIALPVIVLAYILRLVLGPLDDLGRGFLRLFFPPEFVVVGTGILVVLVLLYLLGRVDVYYEGRADSLWHRVMRRIPFVGSLVLSSGAALTLQELGKMTPCKFWLSDTTPHYGFIVREQKVRGAETEIDVYRPNVPSIIPGDLMPLKKRLVIKLANPPGEVLQKLASGGFFSAAEEVPVPWDDETEEDFRERINLTPLEIAVKKIINSNPRAGLPGGGQDQATRETRLHENVILPGGRSDPREAGWESSEAGPGEVGGEGGT